MEFGVWRLHGGREHMELLAKIAPDEFDVLHYAAVAVLKSKKE